MIHKPDQQEGMETQGLSKQQLWSPGGLKSYSAAETFEKKCTNKKEANGNTTTVEINILATMIKLTYW